MRQMTALAALVALGFSLSAQPGAARDLGNEVTGNWAGPEGGGFYFRAQLGVEVDRAPLKIWSGTDAVPGRNGRPELDVPDFSLAAFATGLRLEVVDTSDGSILQVITEFADEEAEGREVVGIQFRDFQYTIVSYSHEMELDNFEGVSTHYSCTVDTLAGRVNDNGRALRLPAMDSAALNASDWRTAAAFDRGWCSRAGEGG